MWWANATRTWTTIPEFWNFDPATGTAQTLDWPREVVFAAGHVYLWFYSDKIRRVAPDGSIAVLELDGRGLRFMPNTESGQGHKLDAKSPYGPIAGLFGDHDRLVVATRTEVIRFENVETDRVLVDAGHYALPNPNQIARVNLGGMRDDDTFVICDGASHAVWQLDMRRSTISLLAGRPGEAGHRDGPAANALFSDPSHVCSTRDAWFVTDRSNHVVRRIDRNARTVTTYGTPGATGLVDGNGVQARFERPRGMCAAHGRIWIADIAGAVRSLDPASGEVSTFHPAGGGWTPSSVCSIPGGLAACSMQTPTLIALPVR